MRGLEKLEKNRAHICKPLREGVLVFWTAKLIKSPLNMTLSPGFEPTGTDLNECHNQKGYI